MKDKSIVDQIKERMSVSDYMQKEHGAKIVRGRCKSFRADAENNTSFLANDRDWYDFGSGIGGDIIDLVAHDKFSGEKGEAIKYLAEQLGLSEFKAIPEIAIHFKSYLKIIDLASEFFYTRLQKQHIDYLHGRGLTDETIKALRIGWADNPCKFIKSNGFNQEQINDSGVAGMLNRLVIPYLRNGKAVYLIGRASVWGEASEGDEKYKKLYRNEYSEHPIWGFESLRRDGDVIIAEGIFDAISVWQEGYPVVTAVTGAFSSEQKKDLFPALKGRDVIICMDYDPVTKAGQKFTEKLAGELFEHGITVRCVLLNGHDEKEDLSNIYAKEPSRETLETLFRKAENYEAIIIKRIAAIENENEKRSQLTAFLRRCAACFDWPTVAQLINDAKESGAFAEVWLKELTKTLKTAPVDDAVVRDFVQKNDCLYHESLGWYEYSNGVWLKLLETEIRKRVAELYGRYRTNPRVNSVYHLLQGELIYKSNFDQSVDVINFPSGMLDIKTGKIKPHSREYYSAIQLDYAYDPNADCPKWREFIADITDDDEARTNLLQEMFGYCLTKDTRYQKCFFLLGEGANGKSVLLHVLKALVGAANTSHVEISNLDSPFERICLHNKLVNIATETKSDVQGTEATFKQVVAGDPISGCFKGKDFVTFTPFCKIIFAANDQIQTRDLSHGFLRRICFIKFPVEFTGDTLIPGRKQKKKITGLQDTLLQELPGIFNWAVNGLKALRENDRFTLTSDQTELTRELIIISNPLVSFIEDVIGNGGTKWNEWNPRKEIYAFYRDWCRETNTMPMSSRCFWPRLRTILPLEEKKVVGDRYIKFDPAQIRLPYCGDFCGDSPPKNG